MLIRGGVTIPSPGELGKEPNQVTKKVEATGDLREKMT